MTGEWRTGHPLKHVSRELMDCEVGWPVNHMLRFIPYHCSLSHSAWRWRSCSSVLIHCLWTHQTFWVFPLNLFTGRWLLWPRSDLCVCPHQALDGDFSEDNRNKCRVATATLIAAVENLTAFASNPEFVSVPAQISSEVGSLHSNSDIEACG